MPVVEYAPRRPVGVTTLMAVGDPPEKYWAGLSPRAKGVAVGAALYVAARFLGFSRLIAAGVGGLAGYLAGKP